MAAQKISVADYAKQTGQSVDVVSRRINGKIDLSLTDVETFAKLTGYQPGDFLNDQFVLLQCLFDRFGSVFPQCGLMVFPGAVIVSR